jgi:hypothetical protein
MTVARRHRSMHSGKALILGWRNCLSEAQSGGGLIPPAISYGLGNVLQVLDARAPRFMCRAGHLNARYSAGKWRPLPPAHPVIAVRANRSSRLLAHVLDRQPARRQGDGGFTVWFERPTCRGQFPKPAARLAAGSRRGRGLCQFGALMPAAGYSLSRPPDEPRGRAHGATRSELA